MGGRQKSRLRKRGKKKKKTSPPGKAPFFCSASLSLRRRQASRRKLAITLDGERRGRGEERGDGVERQRGEKKIKTSERKRLDLQLFSSVSTESMTFSPFDQSTTPSPSPSSTF
jgi:hypothetical protein